MWTVSIGFATWLWCMNIIDARFGAVAGDAVPSYSPHEVLSKHSLEYVPHGPLARIEAPQYI